MSNEVFVFGSNLLGIHGAGSALAARGRGFPLGLGSGLHLPSMCYALPTKVSPSGPMDQMDVRLYVDQFIELADRLSDLRFKVTCVGCGLAGFKHRDIAPMFLSAPPNCLFDEKWQFILGRGHKYWGTF
jgi:hypothetical protein